MLLKYICVSKSDQTPPLQPEAVRLKTTSNNINLFLAVDLLVQKVSDQYQDAFGSIRDCVHTENEHNKSENPYFFLNYD